MKRGHVLLISAGLRAPKKAGNPYGHLHRYLNFGFLGLASILARKGFSPRLWHGNFSDPESFGLQILSRGMLETSFPLLLSLPSSLSVNWAAEFCRFVRKHRPEIPIVAGGRWVVGTDGRWVKRRVPEIDLVVYGTAEERIEDLLFPARWNDVLFTDRNLSASKSGSDYAFPELDYGLVEEFRDFHPSVEVSRGCGMGCVFCADKDSPLSKMRSPELVLEDFSQVVDTYRSENLHPYLEASFFRPSSKWAHDFRALVQRTKFKLSWRCETRVDSLSPNMIRDLAGSGLKVLDLGLESASTQQLMAMGKSTRPEHYLARASRLLRECHENGVWVKVNVLLFAGETDETLYDTWEWLEKHRRFIKGLSVGPLFIYRTDTINRNYIENLERLGARIVNSNTLETQGYAELHLSENLNNESALDKSLKLSREFMSNRDYFDLKSFSYFPRGFTYSQFQEILECTDAQGLPFGVTESASI